MPATDYRESLSTLVPIALASRFYPRDAMLVRVLAMALCPCLCLCPSITSRCSVETNGQNNLVFGMGASFDQSYTIAESHHSIREMLFFYTDGNMPMGRSFATV